MAYIALNKSDNIIYSIDDWQKTLINETPYCPVCGEITEIKARSSVYMKTHFAHGQLKDCPTIKDNHGKYTLLPPTERDEDNGKKLICWAKVNTHHLYIKCQEILQGKLKFVEFSDILDKANNNSIWFYKGLTYETLPYVLIVNYGVFPKVKDIRNEEVHYIFNKSAYGDDLFLKKKISHIYRVSDSEIESIELNYILKNTAPHYFWDYVKTFINKK